MAARTVPSGRRGRVQLPAAPARSVPPRAPGRTPAGNVPAGPGQQRGRVSVPTAPRGGR